MRTREKAEESLLTGNKIKESKEVKENEKAHKEFLRLSKLLMNIEKNDDLYGGAINRYCMLYAECSDFEEKREKIYSMMKELEGRAGEMEFTEYIRMQDNLSRQLISYDKQVQVKRKMMLDIEKENIMTIASALRSVPKTPEKKSNPLKDALSG